MALFDILPLSETIIITTVFSSTGSKLINFKARLVFAGVSAKEVRLVISESTVAACSIVFSNSLTLE